MTQSIGALPSKSEIPHKSAGCVDKQPEQVTLGQQTT
jgi:hypothetical protein